MAGRSQKFTLRQVEEALRQSAGVKILAAQKLRCDRATIDRYVKRYPSLKVTIAEAIESTLDLAEGQLIKQIGEGNLTAVIYFLKTKGKHRGYTERIEATGADGGPIEMKDAGPQLDLSKLSTDEIRALRALVAKAGRAADAGRAGQGTR